jgi:hypothetical protein
MITANLNIILFVFVMIMPNIIAVEFTLKDEIGNILWMSRQAQFARAIFIYADVEERLNSTDSDFGYMEISNLNGTRCFPVAVCSRKFGCYHCLNTFTRQMIDICFRRIANELEKRQGEIDSVFFIVDNFFNCLIDVREHAFVGTDIIGYVTKKIRELSPNQNVKIFVKRNRYTF